MGKYARPAVWGLGFLLIGAAGAQAQTVPYAAADPGAYVAGPAPATVTSGQTPWHVCLNRTFSYGYGSPEYSLNCAPEGTWVGTWATRDPYAWYRPYSDNLGPKPSS